MITTRNISHKLNNLQSLLHATIISKCRCLFSKEINLQCHIGRACLLSLHLLSISMFWCGRRQAVRQTALLHLNYLCSLEKWLYLIKVLVYKVPWKYTKDSKSGLWCNYPVFKHVWFQSIFLFIKFLLSKL